MKHTELSFLTTDFSLSATHQTSFGGRNLYDSVSFCNRCNICSQVCPIHRLNSLETDSPRGRNQAIRLVLERKLELAQPTLQQSFAACTLCGNCAQTCAAHLPTDQHVLEIQRVLCKRKLPLLLHALLTLRGRSPAFFSILIRLGLCLRPLWRLGAYVPGMRWLKPAAARITQTAPSLKTAFKKAQLPYQTQTPQFIYLPSLEAEFLQPQIAVSSLRLLTKRGETTCWLNTASGLFDYVYGDLRQSKRLLRRLIRQHSQTALGFLPLVTDSLDVYNFLKQAPQLFEPYDHATRAARQFAEHVQFITDFFPEDLTIRSDVKLPVRLDRGALFGRQNESVGKSFSLFKTLFKQNFVECEYTDFDTPAFGYAFSAGNQNERLMLQVVKQTARKQIKTIFTFSGLCALELNDALRRFYPAAKAQHVVSVTDEL